MSRAVYATLTPTAILCGDSAHCAVPTSPACGTPGLSWSGAARAVPTPTANFFFRNRALYTVPSNGGLYAKINGRVRRVQRQHRRRFFLARASRYARFPSQQRRALRQHIMVGCGACNANTDGNFSEHRALCTVSTSATAGFTLTTTGRARRVQRRHRRRSSVCGHHALCAVPNAASACFTSNNFGRAACSAPPPTASECDLGSPVAATSRCEAVHCAVGKSAAWTCQQRFLEGWR